MDLACSDAIVISCPEWVGLQLGYGVTEGNNPARETVQFVYSGAICWPEKRERLRVAARVSARQGDTQIQEKQRVGASAIISGNVDRIWCRLHQSQVSFSIA